MAYDLVAALHVLQHGGERVTSKYGRRTIYIGGRWNTNFHSGIDLVRRGAGTDAIVAAARGFVTGARNTVSGYTEALASGNYVTLGHADGYATEYKHLAKGSVHVAPGDIVEKGQVIGYMGSTGWSTGNHLHFGVRVNAKTVDPEPYLLGQKTVLGYQGGKALMANKKLALNGVPLFAASTATHTAARANGTYYLWSVHPINGRYRITNRTANIGRAGQVTGWIDAVHVGAQQQQTVDDGTAAQLAACRAALGRIREIVESV